MINKVTTMQSFYNVKHFNFNDIDEEKLEIIIARSKRFNKIFQSKHIKEPKFERYLKFMQLLHSNFRKIKPVNNEYATTSNSEKFLLFMFSVDPEFEAAIIYASENRTIDIKNKIQEKLGVYDKNLIIIEKAVIELLLTNEKRNEINEEIERRVFN